MQIKTADLCDEHAADVRVAAPIFRDYGGNMAFKGPVSTVQVYEDNVLVRAALEESGAGRGLVVHGCIRDSATVARLAIGVKALATNPLRSAKLGAGARDVPVSFAGLTFTPGHYLYADEDGIIVAERALEL